MIRALFIFFGQFFVYVFFLGPLFTSLLKKELSFVFRSYWEYIDLPSFLIVFSAFLALGMGGGIRDFFLGYFRAGRGDVRQWKKSLASVRTLRRIVFPWSVLGFLIGAVLILSNLDDTASMSRGFSCAVLTIHYGLAFILIFCLPMEMRLKLRLAALEA